MTTTTTTQTKTPTLSERFTKTINALQSRNKNEWEVADALLAEVTPSTRGYHTGAKGTWEQLSAALADQGIDYSVSTLRQYRDTAAAWAPEKRFSDVSFTAHRYAKKSSDPVAVIERIKKLKGKVTTADVKSAVATKGKQRRVSTLGLAALTHGLTGLTKTSIKQVANVPTGVVALEALRKAMTQASANINDVLAAKAAPKKSVASKSSKQPAAKKPASKPAAKNVRKGRNRG